MNSYEAIKAVQEAFLQDFGIKVKVDVFAHLTENLTDREAKLMQSILVKQAIDSGEDGITTAATRVPSDTFTNYLILSENLNVNLLVR